MTLLLFSAVKVSAQTGPPALTLQNIAQQMPHVVAELKTHVKVVPRDTTVFHWTNPSALLYRGAATGADDQQISDYINNYTSRYWNPANGEGLYFAQDPTSSAYAGTALLVAVVAANTRFLDTTNTASGKELEFSPESRAELARFGCNDFIYGNVFGSRLCLDIKKVLLPYLKVKFYIYSYQWRSLPKVCRPKMKKVALVVFDSSAIVKSSSAAFDPRYNFPQSFTKMASILASFLDEKHFSGGVDVYAASLIGKLIPQKMQSAGAVFRPWATQNLFDCAW